MSKVKIMTVFGTRPEAIKLAPLIRLAKKRAGEFDVVTAVTAQHREMLDDVLGAFQIEPDYDLNLMTPGQTLCLLTSRIFAKMEPVISECEPDVIVVQGDTTTTFAAAMAGYYCRKKIAHVEAGLRTFDKWAPFPEEINRKATSAVADYHFPPTKRARENLREEGYVENVHVTGNTVIDALLWMADKVKNVACPVREMEPVLAAFPRICLITGHRRENFGEPFRLICEALGNLARQNPEVAFCYPVHLNPNVQKPVKQLLSGLDNFFLLPPLSYPDFVWLMQKAYIIITDSGGVQEEAPALSKPVLVTRKVSERPEALEAGAVKLVGSDPEAILREAGSLLNDESRYQTMSLGISPYGDGQASKRILDVLSGALT